MATAKGIASVLALIHEAFPTRQITEATAEAWLLIFGAESDADMMDAATRCIMDPTREFFPTPGQFRAILYPPIAVDVEKIRRRIESLGYHNAHSGWVWPRVEQVRAELGDGVADAYGAVGGMRLGADAGTGLDIAIREFSVELQAIAARDPNALLPPVPLPALESGEPVEDVDVKKIVDDVAKKLNAKKEPEE